MPWISLGNWSNYPPNTQRVYAEDGGEGNWWVRDENGNNVGYCSDLTSQTPARPMRQRRGYYPRQRAWGVYMRDPYTVCVVQKLVKHGPHMRMHDLKRDAVYTAAQLAKRWGLRMLVERGREGARRLAPATVQERDGRVEYEREEVSF